MTQKIRPEHQPPSNRVHPPARNPCGSCPYRRDVPSGVWDEEEYAKLPLYDGPTFEQPPGMFMCHQQNGRLCSGWVGCHDMQESMAIRMGVISGQLDPADVDEIFDYETSVPLFGSGAEAAEHGMDELYTPGPKAGKIIHKLTRRRAR